MSSKIKAIRAREILDSRGNPTVAVRVELEGGFFGNAAVPSGASTGTHEALELRDGDKKRYEGKGVTHAVENVNGKISKKLLGMDGTLQRRIDETMLNIDGTENKSSLGANAILGVSLAVARAAAAARNVPPYKHIRSVYGVRAEDYRLPTPLMNILNGGRHADFAIDLQECMIVPKLKRFADRVRAGSEVFHALGRILKKKGHSIGVGDEGGYAPHLGGNEEAFELIVDAIEDAGYTPGKDIVLGIDAAASEFYDADSRKYSLQADDKKLTAAELVLTYEKWLKKYPLMLIEDGLAEDDWEHWEDFTARLGKKMTLVGDDIFVTNTRRIEMGIRRKVANAVLIKLNQIGSLSETMDAIALAQEHDYKVAISHRSGETADTFIADLAVAVNADYIKTGSLSRSERVEKYNRLMEIEEEVG